VSHNLSLDQKDSITQDQIALKHLWSSLFSKKSSLKKLLCQVFFIQFIFLLDLNLAIMKFQSKEFLLSELNSEEAILLSKTAFT